MTANIKERQNVFFDMEAYLPKKNGYEPSDFLLQAPTPCWGVRLLGQGGTRGGTLLSLLLPLQEELQSLPCDWECRP